ncbi:peptidase M23 [Thalassobaculum fulvum]|uniref:Peptidase M23 n=1 Tax=Thalassobaculum fulvum TaxID=1633335 RepID=A0A919CQI4_9PROT|nr:M23 family metallopeptidase [Thalassobaculum fulvum]GHD48733.1 peptidase M23 [Thalassobaculum fulvum]
MTDDAIGWADRLKGGVRRFFPERQIILRTDGETSYIRLTTGLQLAALGGWLAFAGWVGFTTVGYYTQGAMILAKNESIDRSRQAYRKLLDQVSDYQLSIVGITRDLKETEAHLRRLFSQNEALKQDLNSTEVALRTSEKERARIANARVALGDQLELLGSELRQMTGKNNALEAHIGTLRRHLETIEAEKAEIAAERAALDDRLWALHNELESSSSKIALLQNNVKALKGDLRTVILERSAIASDNDGLRNQLSSLQRVLEEERDAHRTELRRISDRAQANIRTVEEVIKRTGLKLDAIAPLPPKQIMGQGGPFVPYHPDMQVEEDEDSLRVSLTQRLERWEALRGVFVSLPLVPPVANYRISSRFGPRVDPLNGRRAMHDGLDMAGPYKEPVTATADGTVVFAGRRRAYGRVVEIDHGHGLMTRYAHLAKITVRRGEAVRLGRTIGLLGSSGRSSGPHVHYEVRYHGRALNPAKFLKAGAYVQSKEAD